MSPAASNSEARKREAARNAPPNTTGLREAVEKRIAEFERAAVMGVPDDPHDSYRRMAYQNAAAALRADLAAHPDPMPEQDVRCDTCSDTGRIPWMSEGDPNFYQEPDSEGMLPCPDCSPEPDATVSDPAPLTDAEREALEGAIADGRVSDSIIQHGPPKDHALLHRVLRAECARFVEHAAPTVERIVAARVAEAVGQERTEACELETLWGAALERALLPADDTKATS